MSSVIITTRLATLSCHLAEHYQTGTRLPPISHTIGLHPVAHELLTPAPLKIGG